MRSLFVCLTTAVLLAGCQKAGSLLPIGAQGTKADLPSALATKLSAADLAKLPALAEQARAARLGTIPPIEGRVDFPPIRAVQASVGDVINFATVTLYDPGLARSVAATVTNSNGGFSLTLGTWVPDPDVPYVVEATKGLGNYLPGWANPRFRTLVRYNSTLKVWESISDPGIVIGAQTTAVAIEAGLYADKVKPDMVFGAVNVSVRPAGFNPLPIFMKKVAGQDNPDYSGHDLAELLKLSSDIMVFLQNDMDPVISVPEVVPKVTGIGPDHGKPGGLVTVSGSGFSPLAGGNKVTFNGVVASVLLAKPTELIVEVPEGASTGALIVEGRAKTDPKTFTIDPTGAAFGIDFVYPNSGPPGTTVTILGFGFAATPTDNTVYFDNVSTKCITSQKNSCTAKVPQGTAENTNLSVDVKDVGRSNDLAFSVTILPVVGGMFPNTGAPRQEVAISGSNYGNVAGSVKFNGVEAPIVSWKDDEVLVQVPFNTITGNLTIAKPSLPAVNVGSFKVLTGTLTGWSTNSPREGHSMGWMARYKNFLYLAGGYSSSQGYTKTTERALINADGTLGAWTVLSGVENPYNHGTYGGFNLATQAQMISGVQPDGTPVTYAYVYGGYQGWMGGGSHSTVLRSKVFSNGDMSPFSPDPRVTLARNFHYEHNVMRVKNYVYVLGGYDPDNNFIQSARINSDATLEPFTSDQTMPIRTRTSAFVVVGRYLYMLGGYSPDIGHHNRIYRSTIDDEGRLGPFEDTGRTVKYRGYADNAAVIGDFVYKFSGYDYVGNVDDAWSYRPEVIRARINPDDTLGDWEGVANPGVNHYIGNIHVIGARLYYSSPHGGSCGHCPHINVATIQ